jgi:hypothetical protein
MAKRLTLKQIATWAWTQDGKPDGHELGEANRRTYEREAESVLRAIRALGYQVVRRD